MDTLRELWENALIRKALGVVLAIVVVWIAARLAKRLVRRRVADRHTRYRAQKGVSFAAFMLALAIVLAQLGGALSGVSVAIGAASAGIAFALQEVIVSVAGWLAIALGGFYKIGDRVQVGGIRGDVIDIGMLRTTLMECGGWVDGDLHNGRVVRVANSFVFKDPVFNYSADFPFLWDEIKVPVKYGSDFAFARTILAEIAEAITGGYAEEARGEWDEFARKYQVEKSQVEPMVTLVANDNWVEFTLRYVVDYKRRRTTKDELFTRILAAFDEAPKRVAFASATFHLVEAPIIDVRLRPS